MSQILRFFFILFLGLILSCDSDEFAVSAPSNQVATLNINAVSLTFSEGDTIRIPIEMDFACTGGCEFLLELEGETSERIDNFTSKSIVFEENSAGDRVILIPTIDNEFNESSEVFIFNLISLNEDSIAIVHPVLNTVSVRLLDDSDEEISPDFSNIFPNVTNVEDLKDSILSKFYPDIIYPDGQARDTLYQKVAPNDNNVLTTIYTGIEFTVNPNEDGSSQVATAGINTEHVYARGWFENDGQIQGDLYNIYPSKMEVNSDRGSLPFGEVNDNSADTWYYLSQEESSVPLSNIELWSERDNNTGVFEPRESVKGDVARVIFYFQTIHIENINTNFFDEMLPILLEWHNDDPVSDEEKERSRKISIIQGNVNPFVTDSTLVGRVYGF